MSRRETAMAGLLTRHGFNVSCFRTTRSATGSTVSVAGTEWHFVPVDPESVPAADNRTTSERLLSTLRRFAPDIIFVKGVGTAMSAALFQLDIKTRAAIIGGAYKVRELTRYHLVLTEVPSQQHFLRPRIGAGGLLQWPKFASDEFFGVQRSANPAIDIITVGRLIPFKNLSLLGGLPARDYRILICGDGPLRGALESELSQGGNMVEFAGQLSTQQLAAALGDARILAQPSRPGEGLPRAIIEGMAAGTPAAFVTGVVDSPVLDDSNSLSAPAEEFCEQVSRLLEDPVRLEGLSAACRATAEREFSHSRLQLAVDDLALRLDTFHRAGRTQVLRTRLDLLAHRLRWNLLEAPQALSKAGVRAAKRLKRAIRRARLRLMRSTRTAPAD
jgi:glycosyltransferase involved in cell wall biosynthesis